MAKKLSESRLGRLGKIVSLSGRVGGTLLARSASKLAGKDGRWAERQTAKQLVATLGQMKGLAQKVGQALSMDIDHIPREVREIISTLQSKSEPMDYSAIARVIEEELGQGPERIFQSFEREPLAAASLGQVHRALTRDGRQVAVKVQYPGAAGAIASDLKNIETLLRAVGAMGGAVGAAGAAIRGRGYFDEVATQLTLETDYRREARSAAEYAEAALRFPELRVPRVLEELSAMRVLTMELLEGQPLSAILKDAPTVPNAQRMQIAAGLVAALYGPLLSTGMLHADPHPGNFLVLPDGRLGVLDFGAVKRHPATLIEGYRAIYRALLQGTEPDYERLIKLVGFEIQASPHEYRPVFAEFFRLMRVPLQTAHFDFGDTALVRDFEATARKSAPVMMKLRPPPDSLLFFRAFGGQGQNLRALAPAGDFRAIYAGVFERAVGPWATAA